jgi:hypothetical protein
VARPNARRGAGLTSISELPARIAALEGAARRRVDRLLDVRQVVAHTEPPPAMEPWLVDTFGSVEAVRRQTVTKVANLATGEATIFAPMRSRRPMDGDSDRDLLTDEIARTDDDPFCDPEQGTPAATFGRVRGAHMVSGANAAAADAHHGVLVFDRHDPLDFDASLVADLLATGRAWAERAAERDSESRNYLLIWNCLWRAGGSIVHGHAQVLLGGGPHYARLERFRRDADAWRAAHATDLVEDLVGVQRDLGLARGGAVATLAHVTPVKEREILVVGQPGMDERDPSFTTAVADALFAYRDRLGVRSFNLVLWRPPLGAAAGWEGMPPMVRMVDRGDLHRRPSDIGAMELYGSPIVGSDPYEVMAAIA